MIRVAVVAPHRQRCSIADYVHLHQGQFPGDIRIIDIELPEPGASRKAWLNAARRANRADLVHVHYEYGLFDPVKPYRNRYARFMRQLRPPRIVTLHDSLPELRPRWKHTRPYRIRDGLRDLAYLPRFAHWDRHIHRLASHYIVHTEALRRRAAEHAGSYHVSFLPMPIPAVQQKWQADPRSVARLITPGFVKPHKGYDRFLSVVADNPTWLWTIAGGAQDERDVACMARLKALADQYRLASRIDFTGYLAREDMEAHLIRATLAIFPFHRVTGSSSIAWAIAAGLPVAATDLSAIRALAQGGAGIELLETNNVESWSEQLCQLLSQPSRLDDLARRNREFAATRSFDMLAEHTGAIYRQLQSGAPHR